MKYDADRLGNKIVARMVENGEKLTTLDEVERTLDENDIVIAIPEKSIGLAGVMGGSLLTNIEVFDVYTGENVGVDEKSIAYNLTFMDSKKTLTEEEVIAVFEKIIAFVEGKCDVKLRG